MTKDLVILGAGGFAREASLLVEEINAAGIRGETWNLLGFIDEDRARWNQKLRGYPVLGGWEALEKAPPGAVVICVVGKPADKRKMVQKALVQARSFINLVHPSVTLAEDVQVGRGVLVNKGTVCTTNIEIGDQVSINPGCGIGHDAVIGAYSTLLWRVNISGAAEIGEGCLIGTGATVLQGIKVGRDCIIGAGAVVTKDLPSGCTAAGVPARVIKEGSVEQGS